MGHILGKGGAGGEGAMLDVVPNEAMGLNAAGLGGDGGKGGEGGGRGREGGKGGVLNVAPDEAVA